MLIHGGLQTAISLISCERGNVRCSLGAGPGRVNTCDPARLVTHSEKRGSLSSLFHLWKEEFKAAGVRPHRHGYNGAVTLFV